jgi:uroporphyrinogen-III synthase
VTTRVLVTRATVQAGSLDASLREAGLEPVGVPSIAVEIDPPGGPLDDAARNLHRYAWAIVTSPNGAKAILRAAERVFTALETPFWAAIGEATATVLEQEGIEVAFQPSRAAAEVLAAELPVAAGEEVVFLRGDLAGDELRERLRARGAIVTDVLAYRTIEGPATSRTILRDSLARGRPDAILFASGSAARGLISLAEAEGVDVRSIPAICIGPETEREAARLGFMVLATSPSPDAASLAATAAAALAQPLETR